MAWFVLLVPVEETGHAPLPLLTRLSYRPVLQHGQTGGDGDNLHPVWSPILFSLPTKVGFSHSIIESGRQMLPPIDMPLDRVVSHGAPPTLTQGRMPNLPAIDGAPFAHITPTSAGKKSVFQDSVHDNKLVVSYLGDITESLLSYHP